jgi:oligopeptide transport system substrate-binding protein
MKILKFLILLCGLSFSLAQAKTIHMGNGSEPETLDPHKAEGTPVSAILRDLFEGLVAEAPNGDTIPGVAERWEISADKSLYTFYLRADAKWSNGDAVTADHFVFSFRRAANPKTLSSYSALLSPILNADAILEGKMPIESLAVVAKSPRILEIKLKGPVPYFLDMLSHATCYPVYPLNLKQHGEGFARAGKLVSNGAYALKDWRVQSFVRAERNSHYWNNKQTRIDEIYWYPTEDLDAENKRYLAGELDVTYDIPITKFKKMKAEIPDQMKVSPYLGVYFYGFNLTKPPFKDNPKLRLALALATDLDVLSGKTAGRGEEAAFGYIPPVRGYPQQKVFWQNMPREQRLNLAKKLMFEAGYGPNNPLEVEILYNTSENHKRMAAVLAAMWKQWLGVNARMVNQEWKVFLDTRKAKVITQAFRMAWIADYNDAYSFLEILHSKHGQNDTGYNNPKFDALLDASALEADAQKRLQLLAEAEKLVLQDLPVMPVYFYNSKHLVKPYVKGWHQNVLDHVYTKYLDIQK